MEVRVAFTVRPELIPQVMRVLKCLLHHTVNYIASAFGTSFLKYPYIAIPQLVQGPVKDKNKGHE